jgi:hypothetical protein
MSDVDLYVNGLAATPVRVRLLRAIQDEPGRIYYEPAAKEAFDFSSGLKVTARLKVMVDHGWVRAKTDDDEWLTGEWSRGRVYYRLTDDGRAAIERGQR